MKTIHGLNARGITLMEALIALLVISLGMLGIARFYGDIIASTGSSKARVEALQVAETAIDTLRAQAMGQAACAVVGGLGMTSTTVPGVNAEFTRQTTVTPNQTLNPTAFLVDVRVSWQDPKVVDPNLQPLVRLSSEIACDNPRASVDLVDGSSGGGGLKASPTGDARMGGDTSYDPSDLQDLLDDGKGNKFADGTTDGTIILLTDDGQRRELIDAATGQVLLTIDGKGGATPSEFSTISGRVYVEGNSPSPGVVRMIISAVGYCAINEPTNNVLPANATGSAVKYRFLQYQCYVGAGWYGSIGIFRTDGMGNNDRICQGDPDEEEPTTAKSTSRHPQLSVIRTYRGFKQIGLDAESNPTYTSVGIGSGDGHTEHDFLLVRITGQPKDSDCLAQLKLTPTPYVAGASEFFNNPGRMVCLTEGRVNPNDSNNLYACPDMWPVGSPPVATGEIKLSGTISADQAGSLDWTDPPGVFAGDLDNACTVTPDLANNSATYECEVTYVGTEGWSGTVRIDEAWLAETKLYASPLAHTRSGELEDVTGLDFVLSSTGPEIEKLQLSGTIKRSTTNVTINSVSVERGTCAPLEWGQNALSTVYSCESGAWAPGSDWLVTLSMGNQSAICNHRTDPTAQTSSTDTTILMEDLQDPALELDINTRRTSGSGAATTCPVFD